MNEFICNYAIARFRPYRETGEFMNVGVVLVCPQLNYFSYLFETAGCKRITDFFPELDVEVFAAGLAGMIQELERVKNRWQAKPMDRFADGARFCELVRPREGLFHFSEIGTALTTDPPAKLLALFDNCITRFTRAGSR